MITNLEILASPSDSPENEELQEMAGGIPGEIGSLMNHYLVAHVYSNKLGRVFNAQTDFLLPTIGKRQPDVAFVSYDRLSVNVREAVPVAPDLAVEVVSKTDDFYEVDDKVDEYLKAGVRLIWVVRPIRKVVEVYHQDHPKMQVRTTDDELDGEDVLPGFKLKVSMLFQ